MELKDDTCAASGAGCDFDFIERFGSWACKFCGRDPTEDETVELRKYRAEAIAANPLTLDAVSKRINTISEDFVDACLRSKRDYDTGLTALIADVDASPDIDKSAVGSIVLGRLKQMIADVEKAISS